MEIITASTIAIIATVMIFRLNRLTEYLHIEFSTDNYLDKHFKYQVLLLVLAGFVLLLTYIQNPGIFVQLFSIGNIDAPAQPVPWIGIEPGDGWLETGLSLLLIITLGTAAFVFMQFRSSKVLIVDTLPYFGWILLFSLLNSFSEEAIYRIGIIAPALGTVEPSTIALVSAVIFGLAHFGGMPHGIIGMTMAGILGWFLARSVLETQGIFWAWSIHFLQDVVIYIGFMANRIMQLRTERAAIIHS